MGAEPLVSIITPCYNGEKYLEKFLQSLYVQDYSNVEIFFVDDGSTDGTFKIVDEFRHKFIERGFKFKYIYQDNAGQAAAINRGLECVKGKYLTWVDSDDVLHYDYLSKKIAFLESNLWCDMVISPVNVVDENKPSVVLSVLERKRKLVDNFFRDLIRFENSYYPPGGYMVRMDAFFKMYPNKKIIESREGQNIQMIVPMAYLDTYGYIDEPLYDYVVHSSSHSHAIRSYEESVIRVNNTSELMEQVILKMPIDNEIKQKEASEVKKQLVRRLFYVSNTYHKKNEMREYYKLMKKNKVITFHDKIIFFKSFFIGGSK